MSKFNWSKEKLESTVKSVQCWWDWLRKLEIPTGGCNYRTLKKKAELYGIDTSHFDHDYARTHNGRRIIKNRTNEEIFNDTTPIKRETVKNAYIQRILGGIAKCECCGITNWNNKPLVFQIHHIDGCQSNNKVNNLKLLCPNCHSQTDNYSNKKRN